MRLRTVNLAGFKSFVDPTSISLPGSLIGVVGPNGCGKSNVIDAVRWVMGEISAKHLRGDMMSDVIFNGSTSRKPVGLASVELVFENSEGRLGARWASYNEISVKRQVARDGHSVYMLNGARCRRRDITDLFLGTGLGSRSYAIIEQGTISRLIEAKPEDLRQFLEEAAGISRYKERRRETENRIRHTRENMERLDDLREELASQLQRLKRQAATAERYKVLKQDERRIGAELLALRWRELDRAATEHEARIAAQDTVVEAALAEQRRVESGLEQQRTVQTETGERFNDVYRQVLETGAEIGRTEESIQRLQEQRTQLEENLEREERSRVESEAHLAHQESRLAELATSLDVDAPALLAQEGRAAAARTAFEESERAMRRFQAEWDEFNRGAAELRQTAHGERTRIEALEAQTGRGRTRLARLEEERSRLDVAGAEAAVAGLETAVAAAESARSDAETRLAERRTRIAILREDVADLEDRLDRLRRRHQEARGRLASLEALQQSALGKQPGTLADWLDVHGLAASPRLAEVLDVESGWERAVEMVLGHHLDAVRAADFDGLVGSLGGSGGGAVTLLADGEEPAPRREDTLASKVSTVRGAPGGLVGRLLAAVRVAAGVGEALDARRRLGEGESVITGDGIWLGPDWARVDRDEGADHGILAREQELKALTRTIEETRDEVAELETGLEARRRELAAAEAEQAELQDGLAEANRAYAAGRSDLAAARAGLEQARRRSDELSREQSELKAQGDLDGAELTAARAALEETLARIAAVDEERANWERRRAELQEALEAGRESWESIHRDAYEVGLRVESKRTELTALEEGGARNREQVERHRARVAELRVSIDGMTSPLAEARAVLERKLGEHRDLEERLKRAREEVEAADERCRVLERQRNESESRVREEREGLGQLRLDSQETVVRRQTVFEQLGEDRERLRELLESLDDDATEEVWTRKVEDMERRISRLGPINLAAIEEFDQQSERKSYLDAQHADLTEALSTLQEAMAKIDRETRARFKETYEQVNRGFETRFPKLFGGGHASLQLTGDDLLSTGVTVLARPPGKRNSTIALLSGGEKALTAIALVFAIFDLNPAPFCLLDEVDAPLDDANVGRFCDLVSELAEQVQVVMVTHNKTTMEITEQLIGVTMVEPGVSRLVAVDVDQAVVMAADG